jgi:UDP-sulfoquinovose synthase
MGVYGYGTAGLRIPEGYLKVTVDTDHGPAEQEILFPPNPGSIYHMTKTQDALLFQFYARNDALRITDLHQGIVWGTQTVETKMDERLINRFDYDGDYGTVLNRFLMQAAVGYPLTVHGSGGQTRAFIHIQDTVRCVELALKNPPKRGDRVKILNHMTESRRVRDLAAMIADKTGAVVHNVANPRQEADENDLVVANDQFRDLGLKPITLAQGLMDEVTDIARRYADRADLGRVPCVSAWNQRRAEALENEARQPRIGNAHNALPTIDLRQIQAIQSRLKIKRRDYLCRRNLQKQRHAWCVQEAGKHGFGRGQRQQLHGFLAQDFSQ